MNQASHWTKSLLVTVAVLPFPETMRLQPAVKSAAGFEWLSAVVLSEAPVGAKEAAEYSFNLEAQKT